MSTETNRLSGEQVAALPQSSPLDLAISRLSWRTWAFWIIGLILLVAVPFALNQFWLLVVTQGAILAIGALGLTVLTGYTGLASLGHAFFLGVGAYAAAYFGGNLGWSFLLWLPLAGIVAGIVGLIVGWLTLRFRGLYLSIVTLGLIYIGDHVFRNWNDISGGVSGRSFPAPVIGGLSWNESSSTLGPLVLSRDQKFYLLVLPILLLLALFTHNVVRTRMGRAFQAVRDREVAAELMGINISRTKIIAFTYSSVLGGLSGALFAAYLREVQPDFWGLDLSIQFLAMIIIGGIVSVTGPILGAVLLAALPQLISGWSSNLPFIQQGAGSGGISVNDFNQIIYALFLALFLVFEPNGLVGLYGRAKRRLKRSPKSA